MNRRQIVKGTESRGLLLAMAFLVTALALSISSPRVLSQGEQPRIEELFGTPPFTQIPPNTSIVVKRITYQPGQMLDLTMPGPIMLFVEEGELAIPEAEEGKPTIFIYSGPVTSPPPVRSDNGHDILPAGYSVLSESGELGLTYNSGSESTMVLAVYLVPEHPEGGAVVVSEATASP